MMNDILMEIKIRSWKRQELYKPPPNVTVPVGKLGCYSDDQYKAIASFLEDLLAWEGPCGLWLADMLGDWLNAIHFTQ